MAIKPRKEIMASLGLSPRFLKFNLRKCNKILAAKAIAPLP